jgi:hypothetical protein
MTYWLTDTISQYSVIVAYTFGEYEDKTNWENFYEKFVFQIAHQAFALLI